jgi:iron complex outermembrane receptor protein
LHYESGTLAFSPSAILNGFVKFHYKGFEAIWHTNYVSRQNLDNTNNKLRSLPEFTVSNVRLGYDWKINKTLKEILFGVNFGNIFNRHYAASAWVYSAIVGNTHPNENRYYQIGYIPMAGFTVMGNVTLRF